MESVIGAERYARLLSVAGEFRAGFASRTVWNVNSTAVGGGVAEMLQVLVGYVEDLGVAIRWLVIHGDAHVRDNFVGDLHLLRYTDAFAAVVARDGRAPTGQ